MRSLNVFQDGIHKSLRSSHRTEEIKSLTDLKPHLIFSVRGVCASTAVTDLRSNTSHDAENRMRFFRALSICAVFVLVPDGDKPGNRLIRLV